MMRERARLNSSLEDVQQAMPDKGNRMGTSRRVGGGGGGGGGEKGGRGMTTVFLQANAMDTNGRNINKYLFV